MAFQVSDLISDKKSSNYAAAPIAMSVPVSDMVLMKTMMTLRHG
jgi:hypothetical protein